MITRHHIGGGSVVIDEEIKRITYEKDIDFEQLTREWWENKLKIELMADGSPGYYNGKEHNDFVSPHIRFDPGWEIVNPWNLMNCFPMIEGCYNFWFMCFSKSNMYYIQKRRVYPDKFGRVFVAEGEVLALFLENPAPGPEPERRIEIHACNELTLQYYSINQKEFLKQYKHHKMVIPY